MKILGIDIGGTKTSVCVGTTAGEIIHSKRIATEPEKGPATVLDRMVDLCKQVLAQGKLAAADIGAVGIAAPGPVDVKRGLLLTPPNMPGWDEVPLVKHFQNAFQKPVFMNNDANACALAEHEFGCGKGVNDMVYLTNSTGMGGGIIIKGKLVQGVTDMAGEIGHMVLDAGGPPCACGLHGCFEVYCGGRSVANRLKEKIRAQHVETAILAKAGGNLEQIDFKAFVEAARENDPFALREWQEYVERMAQGLGTTIMVLNPELIVLGTIATKVGDFLMVPLRKRLPSYAWGKAIEACRVVTSSLGTRSGDYGALAVAIEGSRQANAD